MAGSLNLLTDIGVGNTHPEDRETSDDIFSPSAEIALTLEVISDLTRALERAETFINDRPHWYQKCYPSTCIPLSHGTLQAKEDTEAIDRSMLAMHALKRGIEATQHVSSWLETQHTACEEAVGTLKLRAGLLRLPKGILSIILAYASHQTTSNEMVDVESSANAITKLSLVCSHFRNVMLGTPDYWDRIASSMSDDAVDAYLFRRGVGNLQIIVAMSSFKGGVELLAFWQRIAQNAHLWNRFVLHHQEANAEDMHYLVVWEPEARGVYAPGLTEILIRLPSFSRQIQLQGVEGFEFDQNDRSLHFYSSWNTPNLRSMIMENLVPVPFLGTFSLTSLQILLDFRPFRGLTMRFFTALSTFLSLCPVLRRFALEIRDSMSVENMQRNTVEVRSITELTLMFPYCSSDVPKSLFRLIHFPGIQSFELGCSLDPDGYDVMRKALSQCPSFPKLTKLSIRVLDTDYYAQLEQTKTLWFTIPSLPHLRCLEFATLDATLRPLQAYSDLPGLQTLVFKNCTADMLYFKQFCDHIRLQHRPGPPIKLRIEGCPWKNSLQEIYMAMGDPQNIGLAVDDDE
ncbi:hypothetical protein SCHPADRAFT_944616 [Schizopora paradoxa]|uniref:F-box domain-containing protein n=1 Tax=Schizopora paradoxa TaxID=27342 RepID=A0A0H2R8R8_9AGAM|nr:hypothetical protein SCHPADRAFT_944616 [Schizopora paradoxa]